LAETIPGRKAAREAVRLRSLAPTITTPAVKARVLEQAQEHAMRAGLEAEQSS
jgi:hypothetical protein